MRRGKSVLKLPVITLDKASKVGVVKDLAIDTDRRKVAGLIVEPVDRKEQSKLIRFDSVQRIGTDAVLIENEAAVSPIPERAVQMALVEGPNRLSGLQVLTDAGRAAGKITDILIDEQSGAVLQYEVSTGRLRDLVGGKRSIPSTAPVAVGTEAMIVPESAIADRQAQVEAGPPLLLETPSPEFVGEREEGIQELAAELVSEQEDLILGKRSEKTLANEDAGGMIIFEGEPITKETIQRAKAAGKLNLLVEVSGEPMAMALSRGLIEEHARRSIGRMAERTVRSPEGEVLVAQGDVITADIVKKAGEMGVLDQLTL